MESQRRLRDIYTCCFFVLLRFLTKLSVEFQYTIVKILCLYLTTLKNKKQKQSKKKKKNLYCYYYNYGENIEHRLLEHRTLEHTI